MSAPIEDQLRTYFAFVEEQSLSVGTSGAEHPPDDTNTEIIVLPTDHPARTRVLSARSLATAAVALLLAAVAGVLLLVDFRDDAEGVTATAPPPSPAQEIAEDLVAALNEPDPVALRSIKADEVGSRPVVYATDADTLVALLPWFDLIELEVTITSCSADGEFVVTCGADLDSRFEEADGFVHPRASVEVLLSRTGGIREAGLFFLDRGDTFDGTNAVNFRTHFREFLDFVAERDPDAADLLVTAPGDGMPRAAATPEAMALWETYLGAFIADRTVAGS